jgi:hypothetical protein
MAPTGAQSDNLFDVDGAASRTRRSSMRSTCVNCNERKLPPPPGTVAIAVDRKTRNKITRCACTADALPG